MDIARSNLSKYANGGQAGSTRDNWNTIILIDVLKDKAERFKLAENKDYPVTNCITRGGQFVNIFKYNQIKFGIIGRQLRFSKVVKLTCHIIPFITACQWPLVAGLCRARTHFRFGEFTLIQLVS